MKKKRLITMMMSAVLFLGGCGSSFDMNVVQPASENSGSDKNYFSIGEWSESGTGKYDHSQSAQNGQESSTTGTLSSYADAIGVFRNRSKDAPVYEEPSEDAKQVRTIDGNKAVPIYNIQCIDNALWFQIGNKQWMTSVYYEAEQLQLYVCDEIVRAAKQEKWTGIKIDPEQYLVSLDFVDIIPIFIKDIEIDKQNFSYILEVGDRYMPYSIVFPPEEYDGMAVGYLFVKNQQPGREKFEYTVNESKSITFSVRVR